MQRRLHERAAPESYLNQFFRELHELERIQRMRGGERLPAPAAVDVTLCAENGTIESASVAPAKTEVLPSDGASLPEPVIVDHHPDPAAKVALVDSERQTVPPTDEQIPARRATLPVADVDRGTVNQPPQPWRPTVRSGPIWSQKK